jgi:hypothetical protein
MSAIRYWFDGDFGKGENEQLSRETRGISDNFD